MHQSRRLQRKLEANRRHENCPLPPPEQTHDREGRAHKLPSIKKAG